MIKRMFREWRMILLVIFVVLSIISINPFPKSGVLVTSVYSNSSLYGKVLPGEYITWANEKVINKPQDLYQFDDFSGSFRFLHNGKLEVDELKSTGFL